MIAEAFLACALALPPADIHPFPVRIYVDMVRIVRSIRPRYTVVFSKDSVLLPLERLPVIVDGYRVYLRRNGA